MAVFLARPVFGLADYIEKRRRFTSESPTGIRVTLKYIECEVHDKRKQERELTLDTGLQKLDLSNMEILSIDLNSLTVFSNLEELDLSDNNIWDINLEPLSKCLNLKKINLECNELTQLDLEPLSKCTNLETLDLSLNNLTSINLEFASSCQFLRVLDLAGNEFTRVDLHPLKECRHLQMLDLIDNELTFVDVTPLLGSKEFEILEIDDIPLIARELPEEAEWPSEDWNLKPGIELVDESEYLEWEESVSEPFYDAEPIPPEWLKPRYIRRYLLLGAAGFIIEAILWIVSYGTWYDYFRNLEFMALHPIILLRPPLSD